MTENNQCTENVSNNILRPGQNIRPAMDPKSAKSLVKTLYGLDVTHIDEFNSYEDKNYYVRVSPKHNNPHVTCVRPDGYVLKVLNSFDTLSHHVDAQHAMQDVLCKKGIPCPQRVLTLTGQGYSKEKIIYSTNDAGNVILEKFHASDEEEKPHGVHLVQLMTFIPGKLLADVPYTSELLYKVGRFVGRIDRCLEGFHHEALNKHSTIWNLEYVSELDRFMFAVKDESNKHLVTSTLEAFQEEIVPKYGSLSKGTIHGDCNEQNILVGAKLDDSAAEYSPIAVLDFGDAMYTYYVFEVAYCIMYMMLDSNIIEPLEVGGHILAGYLRERSLSDEDFDALRLCIASRFSTSLVMGCYNHYLNPTNEYVLQTSKKGWTVLRKLMATDKEELYAIWRQIISTYN